VLKLFTTVAIKVRVIYFYFIFFQVNDWFVSVFQTVYV